MYAMIRKKVIIMAVITAFMSLSSCGIYESGDLKTESSGEHLELRATYGIREVPVELTPTEYALPALALCYLGAFRLPEDGVSEKDMFSWGGEALAYSRGNHSLFVVGHSWYTNVAEITIPKPIISKELSKLNQSQILQNFKDIKGDNFDDWTMEIPRVGLEIIGDKLFYCFGEHFEENTSQGTHGCCDLNLNSNSAVCIAGDYLYATNDYIFAIPEGWQADFDGCDLLTGRFRDGGWGGMGPSLFAIRSDDIILSEKDQRISAETVLHYDDSYEGNDGYRMDDYSHADSITGGAFVDCDAGSSVVFAATHGFGRTWYGFSNGIVYPTDGEESAIYPSVPPYPHDQRGWWNDDFRAALILYDPAHLARAISGEVPAYSPQPYAIVDLSEYMLAQKDETRMVYLGGMAYDGEDNRLYVLELFADGDKPVVHVFTFK